MIYHVEYLRPDGWWHVTSADSDKEAFKQMDAQLLQYPHARYRVRADDEVVRDLAEEDERPDDPNNVQMRKFMSDDAWE